MIWWLVVAYLAGLWSALLLAIVVARWSPLPVHGGGQNSREPVKENIVVVKGN